MQNVTFIENPFKIRIIVKICRKLSFWVKNMYLHWYKKLKFYEIFRNFKILKKVVVD